MTSWFLLLGLPLALYVGLVTLPAGQHALRTIMVVGLGLAAGWAAFLLDIGQLASREGPTGAYILIGLAGTTIAAGLAGTLQLLRLRLPTTWPAWVWPAIATLTAMVAAFPFLRVLMN